MSDQRTLPRSTDRETLAVHAGQSVDPTTKARAVPIYATTSYVFDNADHAARLFGLQEFGNIYTRIMNPTTDVFEQRVAALEGGVGALGVASGQAAETLTILNLARPGDNIVTSAYLYGGTYNLSPTLRRNTASISVSSTARSPAEFEKAIDGQDQGDLPRNHRQPAPGCARLRGHRRDRSPARIPVIVDNTLRPAAVAARSNGAPTSLSTRHEMDWRPRHRIGGVVVDSGKFDWAASPRFKADFVDPDESYHGVSYTGFVREPGLHPQAARPTPTRPGASAV